MAGAALHLHTRAHAPWAVAVMVNAKQLTTTKEPAAPVDPLGAAPLHGPPREKHIVVVLGVRH